MMVSVRFLLALLFLVVIGMAILAIFKRSLYDRLSTRIFILIFASWPLAFLVSFVMSQLFYDVELRLRWQLLQQAVIIIGGPVLLGWLAARLARRPLRQFNEAMTSLEQNNYKVQLKRSNIYELDEVFVKFNNLMSRLQHEEKLRKDLVSDTSHELKTPLTTMVGQLTAMEEGKYPLTRERITVIKEQAERLAELVQQLDAYTKARIPDTEASEDIALKRFCEELVTQSDLELKQKSIQVKLDIAEDYIIRASRNALRQILTNLLQNTLRYSGATEITITATAHKLTFSDNGQGVPAKKLPYLFERFYRVDESRNRTTGGLGLGLAIVKELAESQNWSITAAEGRPGLVFVIRLNT